MTIDMGANDIESCGSLSGIGIPANVLVICERTWMCALAPVGPNIHANVTGNGAIAAALLDVL